MKLITTIIIAALIAVAVSGCTIVDAHYRYRHRHHGDAIIVTSVPPPPVIIGPVPHPPHRPQPPFPKAIGCTTGGAA